MKSNKTTNIPIIDLFAGPGGLSEGFAAYSVKSRGLNPFKICASVEMDPFAHRTLELRSFFHEFSKTDVPAEYYMCLRQEISIDELFALYPDEAASAAEKAILATLGKPEDDKVIYEKLEHILAKNKDKPWVLVGGPPCQAYSTIGRSRLQAYGAGQEVHQKDARNFLYRQYLRTIARFKPAIFVMENVKGILSAQVDGKKIFHEILKDLRDPEAALDEYSLRDYISPDEVKKFKYKIYSLVVSKEDGAELDPKDYIIQSEDYGVPQARHRVILLGIREDIDVKPATLTPKKGKVSVRSLLADLPALRSSFTRTVDSTEEWNEFVSAISKQSWFNNYAPAVIDSGAIKSSVMKAKMQEYLAAIQNDLNTGGEYIEGQLDTAYRPDWFNDVRIEGVVNHSARGHMKEDLYRYFFAATFSSIAGRSPRMKDFPKELLPNHKNVSQAIEKGVFDDRFRVQESERPATTITCHIAKDGHYSIHYDPHQVRSLTVREAARLQSFPDNYYFVGPRSQQYRQVGNAVPPLLAVQIADVVYGVLEQINQDNNFVSNDDSNSLESLNVNNTIRKKLKVPVA